MLTHARGRSLVVLIMLAIGILFMFAGGIHLVAQGFLFGLAPILVAICYGGVLVWQLRPSTIEQGVIKKWAARPDAMALITVEIDEQGLHSVQRSTERHIDWRLINRVWDIGTHIVIIEDSRSLASYIIPKSAFATDPDRVAFCDFIRSRIASNQLPAA